MNELRNIVMPFERVRYLKNIKSQWNHQNSFILQIDDFPRPCIRNSDDCNGVVW